MTSPLITILCVYGAIQVFGYWLDFLNLRHMRRHGGTIPPEFEGAVDEGLLKRVESYLTEKTRFQIVTSVCSNMAVIIFLFGGLLDVYNSRVAAIGFSPILSGWLFFLILYLAVELLSIPLSLYFTFRIENRYGFNTMTGRLWIMDFVKTTLLSLILLSLATLVALWLVQWSPRLWWLWVWCFFLAFTIFVTYVSPYLIEPLFNKFTPVEEGPLREGIVRLAEAAGIKVGKVLKMDESKRSTHTNAYFAGIGRTKRIVLFDTLLKSMEEDEILAVLAHEIGHWKRRHLLKGMALTQGIVLAFLFVGYELLKGDFLTSLFRIHADTFYAKVVIAGFLGSMVSFLLGPAMNSLTRRMEKEADRFACDLTGGGRRIQTMVNVLVKLTRDNLSNLHPHPLYVVFEYTHPPVLERIRYIREYCGDSP